MWVRRFGNNKHHVAVNAFISMPAELGSIDSNVRTGGWCDLGVGNLYPQLTWSATSAVGWAAITSSPQGQGAGSVTFRIDSNPDPTPRAGAVLVNDGRIELTQQAALCRFDVSHTNDTISASGGPSQIQVRTNDACSWSAVSEVAWLMVSTPTGRGNGTVAATIAPNDGAERVGAITVAGERVIVRQGAMPTPPAPQPPAPTPPPAPNPPPTPTPTPTPHRNSHTDADADSHTDADAHTDADTDAHADADTDAHADAETDAHSDPYADADAHTDAESESNPTTASTTATAR